MTFILAAERDHDFERSMKLWADYKRYLQENRRALPASAYQLATSDWYYTHEDRRAPHDAWLEWFKFEEPATGRRNEVRRLSLRIRLLNAYHDHYLEFFYPTVYSYTLSSVSSERGHGDWRYDEFKLSPDGHVVHEIEWSKLSGADSRWIIEADDVEFTAFAIAQGE